MGSQLYGGGPALTKEFNIEIYDDATVLSPAGFASNPPTLVWHVPARPFGEGIILRQASFLANGKEGSPVMGIDILDDATTVLDTPPIAVGGAVDVTRFNLPLARTNGVIIAGGSIVTVAVTLTTFTAAANFQVMTVQLVYNPWYGNRLPGA